MRIVKSILIGSAALASVLSMPILIRKTTPIPEIKTEIEEPLSSVEAIAYPYSEADKEALAPIDPDPVPDPTPRPTRTPTPTPTPRPVQLAGSIGTDLPAIYTEWWLRPDDEAAYLVMLKEDDKFRTNVIWTWEGDVSFDIQLIGAGGAILGTLSYNTYGLEPCETQAPCSGYFQRNRLMADVSPNYKDYYTTKIIPTGGTGKIFFYATVIDNKSDDATLITQFRYAKTKEVWALGGLYYYPPGYVPLS